MRDAPAEPATPESRDSDKLTVLELADLVRQLEEKYGVSAAPPIHAAVPRSEAAEGLEVARELGEAVTRLNDVLARTAGYPTIAKEIANVRSRARSWTVGPSQRRSWQARNAANVTSLRERILGDALSSDEAGAYLRRSRPVINKMAKVGRLLAIADGRALRFPRWQFDRDSANGLLPGLTDVLAVMDATSFRKAAWFITPNAALGQTPLDVLRGGNVFAVLEEAKSLVGS
ncbi:MAG TPA: hypothetical protein VGU66_07735 [Candidatus Elarobacter sp.]|nr:hypothetical protein [Candidatus Elarobacter sp.]